VLPASPPTKNAIFPAISVRERGSQSALTAEEGAFIEGIKKAVKASQKLIRSAEKSNGLSDQLGVVHLHRGTYLIKDMNFSVAQLLSLPSVADCIASYCGKFEHPSKKFRFNATAQTLIDANLSTLAVFQPHNQVRGGADARKHRLFQPELSHAGKPGIPAHLALANNLFAKSFGLDQIVVAISLSDPRFTPSAQPQKCALQDNDSEIVILSSTPTPSVEFKRKHSWKSASKVSTYGIATSFLNKMIAADKIDPKFRKTVFESISVRDFQDMASLDLCLGNTDRTLGNFMVSNKLFARAKLGLGRSHEQGGIALIDHADILSYGFVAPANFIWMNWSQAHIPFDPIAKEKILSLDVDEHMETLQRLYSKYPRENLQMMKITYHLAQTGVRHNLTPFQIGLFYSGENEAPSLLMKIFAYATDAKKNCPTVDVVTLTNECITKVIEYVAQHHPTLKDKHAWDQIYPSLGALCEDTIREETID